MKLAEYIAKVGDAAFASKFDVSERAAMSYRLGTRTPRPKLANRIVAATPVTWAGIYAEKVKH